jgi:hypothetical protein
MASISVNDEEKSSERVFIVHSLGAFGGKLRQPAQNVAGSRGTSPSSPNNCMEVSTSQAGKVSD